MGCFLTFSTLEEFVLKKFFSQNFKFVKFWEARTHRKPWLRVYVLFAKRYIRPLGLSIPNLNSCLLDQDVGVPIGEIRLDQIITLTIRFSIKRRMNLKHLLFWHGLPSPFWKGQILNPRDPRPSPAGRFHLIQKVCQDGNPKSSRQGMQPCKYLFMSLYSISIKMVVYIVNCL